MTGLSVMEPASGLTSAPALTVVPDYDITVHQMLFGMFVHNHRKIVSGHTKVTV